METKIKENRRKSGKRSKIAEQKPKSKTRLFWEELNGIKGEIIDMRAVLK